MRSMRSTLLRDLLGLFCIAWLLVAGVVYWQLKARIEGVFDSQLVQASGIVEELSVPELSEGEWHHFTWPNALSGTEYERRVSFQIWEGERLQMRSPSAPEERLAGQLGFSDHLVAGQWWRVFARRAEEERFLVYTAERLDIRRELVRAISLQSIVPLLVALPLAAFAISLCLDRGLRPLSRLATDLAARSTRSTGSLAEDDLPSELRPLAGSLNELLARVRAAFERESRFTADAAHELRTPLAAIRAQGQVALRSRDTEERERALGKLVEAVDRGSRLVEQMLTLARLEPQRVDELFDIVDPAALCHEVVAELALPPERRQTLILVEDRRAAGDRSRIRGSREILGILLRNLLDNALRHAAPAGGRILVEIERDAGEMRLRVSDNGPGIAAAQMERVVERFYRGGTAGNGAGLGLSIVRRIAEIHQAELQLGAGAGGIGLAATVVFPSAVVVLAQAED